MHPATTAEGGREEAGNLHLGNRNCVGCRLHTQKARKDWPKAGWPNVKPLNPRVKPSGRTCSPQRFLVVYSALLDGNFSCGIQGLFPPGPLSRHCRQPAQRSLPKGATASRGLISASRRNPPPHSSLKVRRSAVQGSVLFALTALPSASLRLRVSAVNQLLSTFSFFSPASPTLAPTPAPYSRSTSASPRPPSSAHP